MKIRRLKRKLALMAARMRRKLTMKSKTVRMGVLVAVVLLASGCSSMYRGESMRFYHCAFTITGGGAGRDGDILAQNMAADHTGEETSTPTATITPDIDVGTPATAGGGALANLLNALAAPSTTTTTAAAADCTDGSCQIKD